MSTIYPGSLLDILLSRKLGESPSPDDFGAIGNGVIDDTAAVQLALNSISAIGGILDFPCYRTYLVNGVSLTGKSGFRFTGGGTLKLKNSSPNAVIALTNCSNFYVEVEIDGNAAGQSANRNGLVLTNCTDYLVTGSYLRNAKGFGLVQDNCSGGAITNTKLQVNLAGEYSVTNSSYYAADNQGLPDSHLDDGITEGFLGFGQGTINNNDTVGYVSLNLDRYHSFTGDGTGNEMRGMQSTVRYTRDGNDANIGGLGWDVIGYGTSVVIYGMTLTDGTLRGQYKSFQGELYFQQPVTSPISTPFIGNFIASLSEYTPDYTSTHYAGLLVAQPNGVFASWTASTQKFLSSGAFVIPTTPNGYYFQMVDTVPSGGSSGATGLVEPTWPTTIGLTVPDNQVLWENVGAITVPMSRIRHGYGTWIQNLSDAIGTFAASGAAAHKIDGLGTYGRILWNNSDIREIEPGALGFFTAGVQRGRWDASSLKVGPGDGFSTGAAMEMALAANIGALYAYNHSTAAYLDVQLDGLLLSINGLSFGPVGIGLLPVDIPNDSWLTLPATDSVATRRANVRMIHGSGGLAIPVDGSLEYFADSLYFTKGTTRHDLLASGGGGGGGGMTPAVPYVKNGTDLYITFPQLIKIKPPGSTTFSFMGPQVPTVTTGVNGDMLWETNTILYLEYKATATAPTPPWTATAIIQMDLFTINFVNSISGFRGAGLICMSQYGGEVATPLLFWGCPEILFGHNGYGFYGALVDGSGNCNMGSPNAPFSEGGSQPTYILNTDGFGDFWAPNGGTTMFVRIVNDGTHLSLQISANGQPGTYKQINTVPVLTVFPDPTGFPLAHIGIGVMNVDSTYPTVAHVLHFEVTTP